MEVRIVADDLVAVRVMDPAGVLSCGTVAAAAATRSTIIRASVDSLRQRLTLAHDRISKLQTESQQLRDALAHAHGQLREARQHSQP